MRRKVLLGGKYSPYAWFYNSTINNQAEGQKRDGNIGEHLFMCKKFLNRLSELSHCMCLLENGPDANAEAVQAPTCERNKQHWSFQKGGKRKKLYFLIYVPVSGIWERQRIADTFAECFFCTRRALITLPYIQKQLK